MPNAANPEKEARETLKILSELSHLLSVDLDPEVLTLCVRLCEAGVNPESLAIVVKELYKEGENINQKSNTCLPNQSASTS